MKNVFAVLLLFFLFVSIVKPTYSQSIIDPISGTPIPTQANINYNLSFPGILPDNPLYPLKIIRDKIIISLIKDPLKRIDFYLLQTDKQLLASAILIDKGNLELAKKTALKAENNYTLLDQEVRNNKIKLDNNRYKRLTTAALKHQQILKTLIDRVDKKDKETFSNVLYFSEVNLKELQKMHQNTQRNNLLKR